MKATVYVTHYYSVEVDLDDLKHESWVDGTPKNDDIIQKAENIIVERNTHEWHPYLTEHKIEKEKVDKLPKRKIKRFVY